MKRIITAIVLLISITTAAQNKTLTLTAVGGTSYLYEIPTAVFPVNFTVVKDTLILTDVNKINWINFGGTIYSVKRTQTLEKYESSLLQDWHWSTTLGGTTLIPGKNWGFSTDAITYSNDSLIYTDWGMIADTAQIKPAIKKKSHKK